MAQEAIRKEDSAAARVDWARALVRRERETAGAQYLVRADEVLSQVFERDPENFEARKVLAGIYLARHEYSQAIDLAKKLNKKIPDDVAVYGLLADAYMAIGNYNEAETSAQWMIDFRRGAAGGMLRGALLRELWGDVEGALEWFTTVYRLTSPSETDERAWLLTQIARVQTSSEKFEAAEKTLEQALAVFPDHHVALAQLAQLRTAQSKHAEAVEILRRLVRIAPGLRNQYALGVALKQSGLSAEAARVFAAFESKAAAVVHQALNANRELVFYYADHAGKPADALRIARIETERRQDVWTLDALAWALHANGKDTEARQVLDKALKLGIRDPRIARHSAAIPK
ncbi:MAG: tetratricopeptide repeat protein [Bryobacteraceae bacterium]